MFDSEPDKYDEKRRRAALAASEIENQILPDYPEDRAITSVEDVREAAIQIDLSKSLAAYYIGSVVGHQATAHNDLQGWEWYESEQAQKHRDRIAKIFDKIPDQPL